MAEPWLGLPSRLDEFDRNYRIAPFRCPNILTLVQPLDNAIWQALTTNQVQFAEAFELARKFPEEVSILGGVRERSGAAYESLARLTQERPVGLLLEDRELPAGWRVLSKVRVMQMACDGALEAPSLPAGSPRFAELTAAESPEMVALAELTKPGPFGRRTHELGRYIGLRQDGKLVAMAGERLRLPGYTEVSAVCTDPAYVGRGYARMLMTELMQRIFQRGERPFLHVRSENARAIEL